MRWRRICWFISVCAAASCAGCTMTLSETVATELSQFAADFLRQAIAAFLT